MTQHFAQVCGGGDCLGGRSPGCSPPPLQQQQQPRLSHKRVGPHSCSATPFPCPTHPPPACLPQFGALRTVQVMRDASGVCTGAGFAVFERREAAEGAIAALDGKVQLPGAHKPLEVGGRRGEASTLRLRTARVFEESPPRTPPASACIQ